MSAARDRVFARRKILRAAPQDAAYQAFPPAHKLAMLFWHSCEVSLLVRITRQIEQLLAPVLRPPDIFVAAVGERVKSLFLRCNRWRAQSAAIRAAAPPTAQHRHQAASGDGGRPDHVGQFEQRRHHVLQTRPAAASSSAPQAQSRRRCHDQRDVARAFVRLTFPEITVIAQHLAVVRRDQDHPIAAGPLAPCAKVGHQPGKLFIDLLDEPKIPRLVRRSVSPSSRIRAPFSLPCGCNWRHGRPTPPIATGGSASPMCLSKSRCGGNSGGWGA